MDNTNPNNPSDPNSNNPFSNTPQNAQNTPTVEGSLNPSPVLSQPPVIQDISNTPVINPVFPSTLPVQTTTPTDPSSFLNNPVPTNTYTPSANLNPIPTDQTTPTNIPSPWDQNIIQTPDLASQNISLKVPNPGYPDPATSNPTPNLDFNPTSFNQTLTPDPNIVPTPANSTTDFQTLQVPPTTPTSLNLGGLGSTNAQFSMPATQPPNIENLITANTLTPEPSIVDPNLIVQPGTNISEVNNNPNAESPLNTYNPMIPEQQTPKMEEPAPTDLSHLIDPAMNVNVNSQIYTPSLSQQPETLVVPGNGSEVNTAVTTSSPSGHIPKWVIGLGVGLLIIVAAASAYFILGLGQSAPQPASLPAQQSQLQPPPQTLPSLPNNQPSTASPQANTGSFGELNGATESGTPNASASPRSAADLLRQNQQSQ